MRKQIFWRTLIVAICALVFCFVLHAKTSMYDSAGVKVTPLTSSKLWLNGQKLETPSQQSDGELLFCITVLCCMLVLCLNRDRQVYQPVPAREPGNLPLQYLHRFLRPPPVSN
jgi:hypothetical protein